MTVYVDDWRQRATVGRLSAYWSHLFAGPFDDVAELHQLAELIGLRRCWFQPKAWPHAHYDVTARRRELAIKAGAVAVSWRDGARMKLDARAAVVCPGCGRRQLVDMHGQVHHPAGVAAACAAVSKVNGLNQPALHRCRIAAVGYDGFMSTPDTPQPQTLLEVDSRRRVSLGQLARHERYLASLEPDGTIILVPAVVMPAAQAALLTAAPTAAAVDEFLANPATGTTRTRPRRDN